MSNTLAVATVTASLARHLSHFIADGVPGAQVTFLSPASLSLQGGEPIVNVFLFRVMHNAGLNTNDLPTRVPDGQGMRSSSLAINLDYLISFFGSSAELVPQRLLGLVVAGLHAQPVLPASIISDTVNATPWLQGSDLARQAQPVKFTPTVMAPEQMAQFWSGFANKSYELSVCYQASAVLLDTPTRPGARNSPS